VRLPSLPGAVVDFGAHSLRRFVDVEGAQQATVLAAQAFTSLIPFLVVASAFGPDETDIADRINERFDIHGSAARSVEALFNDAGEVESAVTWVSIVILVLSATSFTRALQKMFQRAYETEVSGWRDGWRGLAWLALFGAWITISSPIRGTFEDVGGVVFAIALSSVLGFFLWLCTPRILLGPMDWRRLMPGASVSAVLGALLGAASGIYVPILLTWSADKYGLIGVAFSIQSWLLATAFVVVIGAVVGAVASETFSRERARAGPPRQPRAQTRSPSRG
jgi:membrane protein